MSILKTKKEDYVVFFNNYKNKSVIAIIFAFVSP